MLTQDRLRKLLVYEPDTGIFCWRLSRGSAKAGRTAGARNVTGYVHIKIDRIGYPAHRLAWLYVRGEPIPQFLDHIDCDRANNRLDNLRSATRSQNGFNRDGAHQNSIGLKGVSRSEYGWSARTSINGKSVHIGFFKTAAEASAAYDAFSSKMHGPFFRNDKSFLKPEHFEPNVWKRQSTRPKGTEIHCNKLTESQVLEAFHSAEANGVVAARFSVSPNAIRCIRLGITWSHLTGANNVP